MSKLNDLLTKNKIDARRLVVASKDLEQLRAEDRAIKLAKRNVKAGGDAAEKHKETASKERRSGRPLAESTVRAAAAGKTVSGPTKTRIVKALNVVLASKKKSEVTLRDVF